MNTTTKDGYALTADIMGRLIELRDKLALDKVVDNIPDTSDSVAIVKWGNESGILPEMLSITADAYMFVYVYINGKEVLASYPNMKMEHEHMWYRVEFPVFTETQVVISVFVPPSVAWSPEDDIEPVCCDCNHVIPSQEIYYTGADKRDYCQHCYDFDKHGVYTE